MRLKSLAAALLLAAPLAPLALAQQAPRPAAYRVQFILHENQPGPAPSQESSAAPAWGRGAPTPA